MSAEVYLYGLKQGEAFALMCGLRATTEKEVAETNAIFEQDGYNGRYLKICSLPEALAARKMREACVLAEAHIMELKAIISRRGGFNSTSGETLSALREALAACGPDYTPAPDPRDEEIRRLREALTKAETALAIAGSYSAPDQRRILEAKERARATLRGDK